MNADSADRARIHDDQVGLIVEVPDAGRRHPGAGAVGAGRPGAVCQRARGVRRQAGTVRLAAPGQAADGPLGSHEKGGHHHLLQHRERACPPVGQRRGVQRRTCRPGRARTPPRRGGAADRAEGGRSGAHPHPAQPRRRRLRRRRAGVQREGIRAVKISLVGARRHRARCRPHRGRRPGRSRCWPTPCTTSPTR